ncbi:MAG: YybH family protein [Thermonemataceae bacterium]
MSIKILLNNVHYLVSACIVLIIVGLFSGKVLAQTSKTIPASIDGFNESEKEKKAILAKREQWRQTFEAKNVESIMTYYVPDILSYDLMAPLQFEGASMWRENWINFFNAFKGDIQLTFEDLTVFQSGNLATIRGLTRLQGTTVHGEELDMWTRETNVMRKINGEWLIVHDHVSVPMSFETGKALINLKPMDDH